MFVRNLQAFQDFRGFNIYGFTVNTSTDTSIILLCYIITSVLTRHYYGKHWPTAAKWQHCQPRGSEGANGAETFVLRMCKLGVPSHVSSVVMTGKVKNRETSASKLDVIGWTVWCKVPDSTAEDFLHTSTTNGITSRLKNNINLNYI